MNPDKNAKRWNKIMPIAKKIGAKSDYDDYTEEQNNEDDLLK